MSIRSEITQSLENYTDQIKVLQKNALILAPIADLDCVISHGTSLWIWVKTREDLQRVLSIASKWDKQYDETTINYVTQIDDIHVKVLAQDSAIPPTCRLEEVEVVVPAQPERTVKKKVIKCVFAEQPAQESCVDTAIAPETPAF